MYLKTIGLRSVGLRAENALDGIRTREIAVALRRGLFNPLALVRMIERAGIPVATIEAPYLAPPHRVLDPLSWCRAGAKAFEAYLTQEGRPDIVHAHNALSAGVLALALKKRHGIPYVLTEHSSYYHQSLVPAAWHGRIRAVIEHASSFMTVSHALFRSIELRIGPTRRTPVITGNVLPKEFAAEPKRRGAARGFSFLSVGSLVPIKNHSLLLSAFAELRRSAPDARLRIVGDGPLRSELECQAANSRLGDAVTFVGERDPPSVRQEMEAADAFVFPSNFETFGVAIIEAMSCGLPVIAMAAGGPEETVTPATGLLVRPGDRDGLVKAMRTVMDGRGQFDPAQIRRHAMDRWSPNVFCARLRNTYRAILDRARTR